MPTWLQVGITLFGGIALVWLLLIAVLFAESRRQSDRPNLKNLLRLAPDVIRLLRRLFADRTLPLAVRLWLGALLVYLISPIDLIPDFIPVLGYADDALVVAIALRFVAKSAGTAALVRHWPGSPVGLSAVLRLAGIPRD